MGGGASLGPLSRLFVRGRAGVKYFTPPHRFPPLALYPELEVEEPTTPSNPSPGPGSGRKGAFCFFSFLMF